MFIAIIGLHFLLSPFRHFFGLDLHRQIQYYLLFSSIPSSALKVTSASTAAYINSFQYHFIDEIITVLLSELLHLLSTNAGRCSPILAVLFFSKGKARAVQKENNPGPHAIFK